MDMKVVAILTLSLILNAGLSVHFLLTNGAGTSDTSFVSENSNNTVSESSTTLEITSGGNSDFQALIDLGLSKAQAKQLIFQQLKDTYRISNSKIENTYWKNTNASKADYILQKQAVQQQIRDELVALIGQSARDEPSFIEVFRPLQAQFPFLTSQEQIAVQKIQIDHQTAIMKAPKVEASLSPFPQRTNSHHLPMSPVSVNVNSILSDQSAFEYVLRTSFLARQLRESDVEFTEESFRKAYRLLADLFPAAPSVIDRYQQRLPDKTLVDRREDLDELLGAMNTLKIMSTLDPEFQKLQLKASGLNLDEEQIMTAYEISLEARMAIFDGIRTREDNPEVGVQMIRQAANNHWNQLSQQLGDEVAEQLLGSSSRRANSQQPQVPTFPANIIKNN